MVRAILDSHENEIYLSPLGMAKAVADVDSGSNQGGFTTEDGNVTGFSTMHDSGTGILSQFRTLVRCVLNLMCRR